MTDERKNEIIKIFNDVKNQNSGDGYLDTYIKKVEKYMTEIYKTEKTFFIKKMCPKFGLAKENFDEYKAYVVPTAMNNKQWGAIIYFSEEGDGFTKRALIAHELGHLAVHFDLLPTMKSEQEVEANFFALQLLCDRSDSYENLKNTEYIMDHYCVSSDKIEKKLAELMENI